LIDVVVLGSTGSIGKSTLAVIARHPDKFRVVALAANSSVEGLAAQVQVHRPAFAVVADPSVPDDRPNSPSTRWLSGRDALLEMAETPDAHVVVNAMVGAAGLEPTLRALRAGKRLALANKESLVAGGPLVLEAAHAGGGELVPIDSEHSAILQCLEGCTPSAVSRIVLTASGGPFRGWGGDELERVRPEDALDHPTWDMGAKISIDSATLANKALEVIEAHFLYEMPYERIGAVVHPQSIIHSFVELVDGSVMAQLGFPTMELPILYALSYPRRVEDGALRTFDPVRASPLTFEEVDRARFPLFGLGEQAGRRGGTAPAVYNAANEVAVEAFLGRRIGFTEIARVVEHALEESAAESVASVEHLLEADARARAAAHEAVRACQTVRS
jgi:1-deoxy-D-xylulose-5-phosphate reductoisomerase